MYLLFGGPKTIASGGFLNISYFHPEPLGEMILFDFRMFFRWVEPPSRLNTVNCLLKKTII